ncbi:MAG: threonine--tRNA ligase [bacterium]
MQEHHFDTEVQEMSPLDTKRHSLAHIMATAVKKLRPDAKFGVGPVIDNGFYYDFDLGKETIKEEEMEKIEQKMMELIGQNIDFVKEEVSRDKAIEVLEKDNQSYKVEIVKDLPADAKISFYHSGGFSDLCKGPHVKNTKELSDTAFKITKTAGAYWRGSEKNPMLQRLYAVAFETKKDLQDYLTMMEEAEKRDHRKLGKELKLFAFSDYVGPGLPLWLPYGAVLAEELEKLAKEKEFEAGYVRVRTPHIAKEIMYKTSGHLPYYADSMFPPMVMKEKEGETIYYLKAMNCPHHHQIYASEPRSYRDLPLRLAEYGTCYRYEQSGELFGLMRVRSLQMNDSHIYCTPEQFADEFKRVNDLYLAYFKLFGIEKYVMRFSTHDSKELGKKYMDEPELWKKTEDMVRQVLIDSKIPYVEVANEAAFYGPKIDVQVWSSIGKEFTLATNQVDFAVPGRFGLVYTDSDGKEKTPLAIHRAPLGTHERFIGFLIEHYAGAFPTWLSPVQVKLLSVADRHIPFCQKLKEEMMMEGIRVEVDDNQESVGKKIRNAVQFKIPYVMVVGDEEEKSGTLAVRKRGSEEAKKTDRNAFLKELLEEIKQRK